MQTTRSNDETRSDDELTYSLSSLITAYLNLKRTVAGGKSVPIARAVVVPVRSLLGADVFNHRVSLFISSRPSPQKASVRLPLSSRTILQSSSMEGFATTFQTAGQHLSLDCRETDGQRSFEFENDAEPFVDFDRSQGHAVWGMGETVLVRLVCNIRWISSQFGFTYCFAVVSGPPCTVLCIVYCFAVVSGPPCAVSRLVYSFAVVSGPPCTVPCIVYSFTVVSGPPWYDMGGYGGSKSGYSNGFPEILKIAKYVFFGDLCSLSTP